MPNYDIHDNGNRPFKVHIAGNGIEVVDTANGKTVYTTVTDEIFIGKKSPGGGYDGLSAKDAVGNTILVRLGERYTFIGEEIYEFSPIKGDKIVKYYSDIGPNDVPYPYAIGKEHVYILLEDKVAVDKTYFDMKAPIYDQYYFAHRVLTNDRSSSDEKKTAKIHQSELEASTTKLRTKQIEKRRWS
jgi:hypothetical protein